MAYLTPAGETSYIFVPTAPLAPDTSLRQSLEGKAPEIYAIGDCQEPRMIVDAVTDAWRLARAI